MSYRANQILQAVIYGNFSNLTYEVTRSNVNYIDPQNRMSLLMWAVALGRLPTVELLLSRGATLFPLDGLGFTVLHRAVWSGDTSIVCALLFLSPESLVPDTRNPFPAKGRIADGAAIADEWQADRKAAAVEQQRAGARQTSSSSESNPGGSGADHTVGHRYPPEQQQQEDEEGSRMNQHMMNSMNNDHNISVFTRWLVTESHKQLAETINSSGGRAVDEETELRRQHRRRAIGSTLRWREGAKRLVNAVHPSTGRTPLMLAAVRGSAHIVDFLVNVCDADMYCRDVEGFTAFDLAALCGHLHILRIFLAKADGDGTGRAFPCLQQRAEEFGETAKTIPQRNVLNDMNRLMALDYSRQSYVSAC